MTRAITGVVVGIMALGLVASPAGAATTTTLHVTTTTTKPHTTTTTRPHTTTTTRPRTTTARAHARRARRRGDFEVVLGITRTRAAAERIVARARRHGLHPGIEVEGRRHHRRFEVEIGGFRTRAAADRELRTVRRDGFRKAFVERS